ncbi:hypothetical protein SAMN05519103_09353 [Rhizobiales bacterium GAS113]|nr:hypothetical protein SAMN05519103_09353 [Rhizobiales bacterium GAS113]
MEKQAKEPETDFIEDGIKLGGSRSGMWNREIISQAIASLWVGNSDAVERNAQVRAIIGALSGIKPQDEIEGMIVAQMLAAHHAAMEAYRRAMKDGQTFDGRHENLNQANKLSRTHVALVEALNRHRGKGQQRVTVEHVTVNAGGQAIVGSVEAPGGGVQPKSEDQPHAKQITHAPGTTMQSTIEADREAVPVARRARS